VDTGVPVFDRPTAAFEHDPQAPFDAGSPDKAPTAVVDRLRRPVG
jgi:hypothetical protein